MPCRRHEGRDQGALARLLGDGSDPSAPALRVIQCDGYSAYPAWSRDKPGVTLAGCHAHVRRKFFEAKDQDPKLVGWILRQLGHLYRIERQLRQARAGPGLREAVRTADARMITFVSRNSSTCWPGVNPSCRRACLARPSAKPSTSGRI